MTVGRILVVGGAGYIGSYVNKALHAAGFETVVLDALWRGHKDAVPQSTLIQGDMGEPATLDKAFASGPFDAVMHFAAFTDIGASFQDPAQYYENNVAKTLQLLKAMVAAKVQHLIFSSSAGIFGLPHSDKIDEEHPCAPINPYGASKLMVEQILADFDRAHGLKSICLRYFNAAGADPDGKIKLYPRKESNLIPRILRNLQAGQGKISIFGTDYPTPDKTCIRDYVHIADLADAHILSLQKLLNEGKSEHYNLGNGQGFSIREVIAAIESVTHREITVTEAGRRPGDPPKLVASAQKAALELGWTPNYPNLETMIRHAWQAMV